jgi:hypothetical protein
MYIYSIDSEWELVHTAISYSCQNRFLYQGKYLLRRTSRLIITSNYIIHKCVFDFGSIEAMPTMTVVIIDGNMYNI